MIISILGALAFIAFVTTSGVFVMNPLMDKLTPRTGFVLAAFIVAVVGGATQLGLGLAIMHLVQTVAAIL